MINCELKLACLKSYWIIFLQTFYYFRRLRKTAASEKSSVTTFEKNCLRNLKGKAIVKLTEKVKTFYYAIWFYMALKT